MARCPRCHQQTAAVPCVHCGAWFADGGLSTPGEATAAIRRAYRVDGVIASGGMGVVLRGTRLRDSLTVAMKAPKTNHALARQRFTREARALATVAHPRIVRLLDIDATPQGTPLLITDFIPGETLHQRLQRPPDLAIHEFNAIARETGEALAHCHGRGVVHRDVKPDNLMLGPDGICLIDFGLALLNPDRRDQQRLTPDGLALGTPPFAAPEQLRSPLEASSKSDCYSYGMVLSQCWQRVDWSPSQSLASQWQRIIGALTLEEPAQRPSLHHCLSNWPQRVSSQSLPQPWRQRRLVAGAAATTALGLLAGAYGLHHLASPQPVREVISGWVEEDGRGGISIAVAPGSRIDVRPLGDTQIRLLGHGPWSSGPLRLTGNESGVVQLRVIALDGNWEIEVAR